MTEPDLLQQLEQVEEKRSKKEKAKSAIKKREITIGVEIMEQAVNFTLSAPGLHTVSRRVLMMGTASQMSTALPNKLVQMLTRGMIQEFRKINLMELQSWWTKANG